MQCSQETEKFSRLSVGVTVPLDVTVPMVTPSCLWLLHSWAWSGISKVVENKEIKGTLTGVTIGTVTSSGTVTPTQKVWRTFQSLGNIAFAYAYSMILIEIQDTLKSPPAEENTMRKATFISVAVTTLFYMLCGCEANLAIVIHLVGAYQVYCQPLLPLWRKKPPRGIQRARVEDHLCDYNNLDLNANAFFNDVLGLLGPSVLASNRSAAAGSVVGIVTDLKSYRPFKTDF
ncbi:hypothetical protein Bca52824_001399 [Brassica carinata]|uniref:Amino acid transporter transmembrane domain-containing protein n=1 Tax=Brassica carinata TaxID=52824 RepID=A0A8X8B9Q9_BRACI|nr:hypothetical protein Bca52824_001399 [Brassica carinata]